MVIYHITEEKYVIAYITDISYLHDHGQVFSWFISTEDLNLVKFTHFSIFSDTAKAGVPG